MLSVVVLTRDEADRLGRCLASVAFAHERVVLDCGSVDATESVARAHGARFVRADWPGFVAQRNRGLALATQPWVLFLDADEWLTDAAARSVTAELEAPRSAAGWRFARCNRWLGRPMRHGRWYPDRSVRCVRRGAGRWIGGRVHERLCCEGPVIDLAGDIGHEPYRDIAEHVRTIRRYSDLAAMDLRDAGRRARRRDRPGAGSTNWSSAAGGGMVGAAWPWRGSAPRTPRGPGGASGS